MRYSAHNNNIDGVVEAGECPQCGGCTCLIGREADGSTCITPAGMKFRATPVGEVCGGDVVGCGWQSDIYEPPRGLQLKFSNPVEISIVVLPPSRETADLISALRKYGLPVSFMETDADGAE